MSLDRQKVREQFAAYTRKYDPEDPKIALKIIHTYKVAENCEAIANSVGLDEKDVDFCWLSGMLHDIGRFEQVKRYNTFIDAESVNHADFGADLLFGPDKLIESFTDDISLYPTLELVIREHNKFRIDESVKGKDLVFCNILRDADKIDIFRANIDTPMEEIYNASTNDLVTAGVTPSILSAVCEHRAILRRDLVTIGDRHISHIALAFELVYPKSREIARKQGYIYKLFDFETINPSMKKALVKTRAEIDQFFMD